MVKTIIRGVVLMGKNGKVDFRELREFQKQLQTQLSGKQLDLFIESCAKALAARLLAKVIERTPVGDYDTEIEVVAKRNSKNHKKGETYTKKVNLSGKVGGTLRRGWTGGKDAKPDEFAEQFNVVHRGDTYVIEIINPIEYASYVEYGHVQTPGRYVPQLGKRLKKTWVEGKFMLRDSEIELHRKAPKVLENKLKKKLEEIFK